MNRFAALTLTTVLLGTGCIVDDDDDDFYDGRDYVDLIVYWDFVRNAPAQTGGAVLYDPYDATTVPPPGICRQSGVDTVEVRTPVETFFFDCVLYNEEARTSVQGAWLFGMPRGRYDYTIIGWRGEVQAYRSTFTIDAFDGSENGLDVDAVRAPIDLFAFFRYGAGEADYYATCDEALRPNVAYAVYDSFGTLVLDAAAGCPSGTRADPLPVFVGDLDLDDYTVRMQGYAANQLIFDSCTWEFDHFDERGQTGEFGIPITLDTNPVPICR